MSILDVPGKVVSSVFRAVGETYGFGRPRSPLPPNEVNKLIESTLEAFKRGGRG